MSFDDISLSFENKCYVIKGENKDDDGQASNGSGKTSLLDIIPIAAIGQSLTDRDLKSCVNRYGNENYFIVSLILANQKDTVKISRKVYNNTKSQELSITVNDKPVIDIPTKAGIENGVDLRKGNEWILNSLFDISKEDLLNYFLISDKHYKGFLSSNNQDKINVISRFSNATKVDEAIERLKLQDKTFNNQKQELEYENSGLKGQINGLNYSISQEAKQKFEHEKERQKSQLIPRVNKLEEQLDELSKELSSLGQHQFECEEFYGRKDDKQLEKLQEQKTEIVWLIDNVQSLIAKTNNQLKGKIICPSCQHEFIIDSEQSVEELNNELQNATNDLSYLSNENKTLEDEIEGDKLLKQIEDDIERYSSQQDSLVKTYESLHQQLQSIEAQQFESPDIKEKISQLEQNIKDNEEKISSIQTEQQQAQDWIERFERFKYFLINKPISIICHQTNQILKQIGCQYSISIDGFRKLKSGELRAELNPIIHIRGIESQPYDQFSTGERTRLDLACDLAIQNMINSNSKGGLNFYMNDEKLANCDSLGISNIAKTFNFLSKSIILVTHSGENLNHENLILIEKKNGRSRLCL